MPGCTPIRSNRLPSLPLPPPAVGAGAAAVPYSFTVDSGSGLLELTCSSTASRANCAGKPMGANYVLNASSVVSTPAVCNAAGVGCLGGGQCYYSQAVSGPGPEAGHGPDASLLGEPLALSVRC